MLVAIGDEQGTNVVRVTVIVFVVVVVIVDVIVVGGDVVPAELVVNWVELVIGVLMLVEEVVPLLVEVDTELDDDLLVELRVELSVTEELLGVPVAEVRMPDVEPEVVEIAEVLVLLLETEVEIELLVDVPDVRVVDVDDTDGLEVVTGMLVERLDVKLV